MKDRAVKKHIKDLLRDEDLEQALVELRKFPSKQLVNPLISSLFSTEEVLKWHAVTAIGQIVSDIAFEDMESARIIMRRFMWSLNDESGGIGWGAPEAMAEIMVCHDQVAEEFAHMLVAYMREDGFFLEHLPLQRGLMWGTGRLASVKPELLLKKEVVHYLLPYLESEDGAVLGLAMYAMGQLGATEAAGTIKKHCNDPRKLTHYFDRRIFITTVGELAEQAISRFSSP